MPSCRLLARIPMIRTPCMEPVSGFLAPDANSCANNGAQAETWSALHVMASAPSAIRMCGRQRWSGSAMSATTGRTKADASSVAVWGSQTRTSARSALCKKRMCVPCHGRAHPAGSVHPQRHADNLCFALYTLGLGLWPLQAMQATCMQCQRSMYQASVVKSVFLACPHWAGLRRS
jgi:hypothetical protein